MNLATKHIEDINSILEEKTIRWLYPILETGQAVCKEFFNINANFFDCNDYINCVPGHILSYGINKQAYNQSQLPLFPFKLNREVINRRNNSATPLLKKGNVTISLLRSPNRFKIEDTDKKYLRQKCKKNNEINTQMYLPDLLLDEENNDQGESYHGVLLYGAVKYWEGINFADIVFFDSNLKEFYHSIDLMDRLHVYETNMTEEEKEKSLLNARNIIKESNKILEV